MSAAAVDAAGADSRRATRRRRGAAGAARAASPCRPCASPPQPPLQPQPPRPPLRAWDRRRAAARAACGGGGASMPAAAAAGLPRKTKRKGTACTDQPKKPKMRVDPLMMPKAKLPTLGPRDQGSGCSSSAASAPCTLLGQSAPSPLSSSTSFSCSGTRSSPAKQK